MSSQMTSLKWKVGEDIMKQDEGHYVFEDQSEEEDIPNEFSDDEFKMEGRESANFAA